MTRAAGQALSPVTRSVDSATRSVPAAGSVTRTAGQALSSVTRPVDSVVPIAGAAVDPVTATLDRRSNPGAGIESAPGAVASSTTPSGSSPADGTFAFASVGTTASPASGSGLASAVKARTHAIVSLPRRKLPAVSGSPQIVPLLVTGAPWAALASPWLSAGPTGGSGGAEATGGAAPERAPATPTPGPGASGATFGGTGSVPLLLFATLLATVALAAPRLGRWLRSTPDAARLQHVITIETPG